MMIVGISRLTTHTLAVTIPAQKVGQFLRHTLPLDLNFVSSLLHNHIQSFQVHTDTLSSDHHTIIIQLDCTLNPHT